MPCIPPPSNLREPAALTPDKNLFFTGPFHNPFLITLYKKYDIAYNAPFLSFSIPFFFTVIIGFSFSWSDGGPPAGGGPRHVPIVPRP